MLRRPPRPAFVKSSSVNLKRKSYGRSARAGDVTRKGPTVLEYAYFTSFNVFVDTRSAGCRPIYVYSFIIGHLRSACVFYMALL